MSIFEDIIKRMMLACGVDKATELADFLGKNQSTISRWRDRGKVPDGAIAQVAAMTKVNYAWLKTGEGEVRPKEEKQPLLPPELAELVAESLDGYNAKGVELSEGAALLVNLYNQMTAEDQRDMLVQASMRVIAQKMSKTEG